MKTTKKHFAFFQKKLLEWCDFLGFSDWRKDYHHVDPDEDTINWRAWTIFSPTENQVGVSLSKDWGNEIVNTCELMYTARHEAFEVLTGEIDLIAKARSVTEEQINKARHNLIFRMENTFGLVMDNLYRIYPEADNNPNKILEILKNCQPTTINNKTFKSYQPVVDEKDKLIVPNV